MINEITTVARRIAREVNSYPITRNRAQHRRIYFDTEGRAIEVRMDMDVRPLGKPTSEAYAAFTSGQRWTWREMQGWLDAVEAARTVTDGIGSVMEWASRVSRAVEEDPTTTPAQALQSLLAAAAEMELESAREVAR